MSENNKIGKYNHINKVKFKCDKIVFKYARLQHQRNYSQF